ncbi:MAG TPA: YeeE/YedE thiosulfate transporter family protein [Anaerolineales bacterium]|nr:YeeE/YedE thiosulfate transporter family protein [Anaerolineales bacterium]
MQTSQPSTFWGKLFARPAKPYIHPYLGGMLLGIVLFLAFLLTRNGLGASGGMNRLVAAAQDVVAPGHIDRTPYLLKLAGGAKNPLDDWSVPVVFGAVLGGMTSGLIFSRFKPELNKGPRISNRTRLMLAFVGGTIMAYGARMARGCTSGQALSGGATLSAGSWALMLCIFAGAYALAYFIRKAWR